MEIKISLFITLLLYAVVSSQSFFYVLAMSDTMKKMKLPAFIESRRLIDRNLRNKLQPVYYFAFSASIVLSAFCLTNPSGILFICSVVALVLLLVDILLALKGNYPLNDEFNSWTSSQYPENWKEVRARWFFIYNLRQAANIIGFIILLAGLVFFMQ